MFVNILRNNLIYQKDCQKIENKNKNKNRFKIKNIRNKEQIPRKKK